MGEGLRMMLPTLLLPLLLVLLLAGCATPRVAEPEDEAAAAGDGPGAPPPVEDLASLWDFGDAVLSETRFRDLVPRAEAAGDEGFVVEALTQVARAQGLQRRFDDAARTLDLAEARLPADAPRARVRLLLERGRLRNSRPGEDDARGPFEEAWRLASAAGEEFLAVDAAHMLGIVVPGEDGVAWNLRAMEAAEAATDPRAKLWLGALYNNTGWTRHDQGRHADARDLFEKCRAWNADHGRGTGERIARWSIAKMDRFLGRPEDALAAQRILLDEYAGAERPDGYVHEEMAECLLVLGREDEARPHFRAAFAILGADEWLQAEEPDRLERLRRLGGEAAETE